MAEEYGLVKAALNSSQRDSKDLLKVPHKGEILVVSKFGPDFYSTNLIQMKKRYFHSSEYSSISFREPTTAESISAAAWNFENEAKPNIFDPGYLLIGTAVMTPEGVFFNVPRDSKGNHISDEKSLKLFLNGAESEKVGLGKIYVVPNRGILKDFGFADYGSFQRGVQNYDTFFQGGLAIVLVHSEEKVVKSLERIASPQNYRVGVDVWAFEPVKEPVVRVVSFSSDVGKNSTRLVLGGSPWGKDYKGFIFGALD